MWGHPGALSSQLSPTSLYRGAPNPRRRCSCRCSLDPIIAIAAVRGEQLTDEDAFTLMVTTSQKATSSCLTSRSDWWTLPTTTRQKSGLQEPTTTPESGLQELGDARSRSELSAALIVNTLAAAGPQVDCGSLDEPRGFGRSRTARHLTRPDSNAIWSQSWQTDDELSGVTLSTSSGDLRK